MTTLQRNLLTSEQFSFFYLLINQKKSFLPQLDPSLFSLIEIQNFNQEFSEEGDEETASLTLESD
jgi:hypothetical protein